MERDDWKAVNASHVPYAVFDVTDSLTVLPASLKIQ